MNQSKVMLGWMFAASILAVSTLVACSTDDPGSDVAAGSEPAGSSIGTTSSAPAEDEATWRIVGLGDSFTATQDSSGQTYLDLFGDRLSVDAGHLVELDDLSDDAGTTARLLDMLRTDESTREVVAAADIILVSVGGNDSDPFGVYPPGTCTPPQPAELCLAAYAPDFADNYEAILAEIDSLRTGRPTAVRVTSADNPFVGWSEAPSKAFGVRFYRQVAEAETEAACGAATKYGGLCVDYLHVFGGPDGTRDPKPYLAADHAHPGDRGIAAIADLLIAMGVPEL